MGDLFGSGFYWLFGNFFNSGWSDDTTREFVGLRGLMDSHSRLDESILPRVKGDHHESPTWSECSDGLRDRVLDRRKLPIYHNADRLKAAEYRLWVKASVLYDLGERHRRGDRGFFSSGHDGASDKVCLWLVCVVLKSLAKLALIYSHEPATRRWDECIVAIEPHIEWSIITY